MTIQARKFLTEILKFIVLNKYSISNLLIKNFHIIKR
jgi:hypothetical protein